MRGLDPRIHQSKDFCEEDGRRVKPGNDPELHSFEDRKSGLSSEAAAAGFSSGFGNSRVSTGAGAAGTAAVVSG
jgi:hypothetical protein